MKTILLLMIVGLLPCCSSIKRYRNPLLLGAGGAAAGSALGDGAPEAAALGGLAGGLVGIGVDAYQNNEQVRAYQVGYNQAQLDRVKHDYWTRQRAHACPCQDPGLKRRYFEIPVPAHDRDGVSYEPHSRVIEIVE